MDSVLIYPVRYSRQAIAWQVGNLTPAPKIERTGLILFSPVPEQFRDHSFPDASTFANTQWFMRAFPASSFPSPPPLSKLINSNYKPHLCEVPYCKKLSVGWGLIHTWYGTAAMGFCTALSTASVPHYKNPLLLSQGYTLAGDESSELTDLLGANTCCHSHQAFNLNTKHEASTKNYHCISLESACLRVLTN